MQRERMPLKRRHFITASTIALLAGCSGGDSSSPPSESGGNGGNPPTKTDESQPTSSAPTTEATDKQETTKARTSASVAVGEAVKGDNLALVARSVEKTASLDQFQKADSGNVFVVIRLAVKNTSDEYLDFNSFWQTRIKDAQNTVYDTSFVSTDHPIQSGTLAPGEVARGDTVYEVPKDATGLKMQFDFSAFSLFKFNRVTIDLEDEANTVADLEQSLNLKVHKSGEAATHGDVSVVLHSVRTATKLGQFTEADSGNEYVIPDIEITNNGSDALTVSTLLQMRLKTGDGLAYMGDLMASTSLDRAYSEGSDISPGESRRGELAYQVSKDARPLYWVFDFLDLSGGFKAFWKLR